MKLQSTGDIVFFAQKICVDEQSVTANGLFASVFLSNMADTIHEFDFANEATGVYVVKIVSEKGQSQTLKLLER